MIFDIMLHNQSNLYNSVFTNDYTQNKYITIIYYLLLSNSEFEIELENVFLIFFLDIVDIQVIFVFL